MRAWILALGCACSSGAPGPRPVIERAVAALDRHDAAALEQEYVSTAQWNSLVDCSKPTSLPIVAPNRDEALAGVRTHAAELASEPELEVKLVRFEPERSDPMGWRDYKAGDPIGASSICVARRPFRVEKYRIALDYSVSFHGARGIDTDIQVWSFDGRYWIKSDMFE
jgi:hypothetical protein